MITLAFALAFLQTRIGGDAPPDQAIEPAAAVETFIATCWRGLRDAGRFHAAIAASPLHFTPAPGRDGIERYRSDRAHILYIDEPDICSMTIRLATPEDATHLVETLTQSLGLRMPERGWVLDVGTEAFQWPQVPIDGLFYELEAEADTAVAPGRPVDLRLSVAFSSRMGTAATQ